MLDHAIARAVVLLAIIGLVWSGIVLAALALTLALTPYVGLAGGAALTATLCFLPALIWLAARGLSRPNSPRLNSNPSQDHSHTAQGNSETAVLTALSALAEEKPLLAVISAGLFGAADVLFKERRK